MAAQEIVGGSRRDATLVRGCHGHASTLRKRQSRLFHNQRPLLQTVSRRVASRVLPLLCKLRGCDVVGFKAARSCCAMQWPSLLEVVNPRNAHAHRARLVRHYG